MSQELMLLWPVGQWDANNSEVPAPGSWPTAVTEVLGGLPATTGPCTFDQAVEFYCRVMEATITLNIDFGGGDSYSDFITVRRVRGNPITSTEYILQGEELYLMPPKEHFLTPDGSGPSPGWFGSREPEAPETNNWQIAIFTEHIWFDKALDIAFYNLFVGLTGTIDVGGNTYDIATITTPGVPTSAYFQSIGGARVAMNSPYSVSILFTPSRWFTYDGRWDEYTGIKL